MQNYNLEIMKDLHSRLSEITEDCRETMHEPDEQGIVAIVIGNHLDNAFGDIPNESNEFIVGINKNGKIEYFNLATLIAVAKKAVL